jgi:AAA15 family ATPase/GTPase
MIKMDNENKEFEQLSTFAEVIAQQPKSKQPVHNPFVMTFVENFERLVPILTKTEMRVMLCIVKFLNYQNVFNLTQKAIAHDTSIPQAAVSRAMKVLRDRKILAETESGIGYINPFLFSKGHLLETKKNINQISFCFEGENLETEEIKKTF